MLYLSGEDNTLAPGVAELHMQENEDLTILLPDGTEIYVSGLRGCSAATTRKNG
jgi:hypothetical protein